MKYWKRVWLRKETHAYSSKEHSHDKSNDKGTVTLVLNTCEHDYGGSMPRTSVAESYLREGRCFGDLIPQPKTFTTESSIIGCGKQVASKAKMRRDDSVHLDKALGVAGGLEPSHPSLPLTCRLM